MNLQPYCPVLEQSSLLRGLTAPEMSTLLACFAPQTRAFSAGEVLLSAGSTTDHAGIILSGRVLAEKLSPGGSRVIVARMGPGGVFADILAGSHRKSPVTVRAESDCLVLRLPFDKLLRPCRELCPGHMKLMENMVTSLGGKYFSLDSRLEILMRKGLRARISLWLLEEYEKTGSPVLELTMNRFALADFLNCERSALSRELGRMQKAGFLKTEPGRIVLTDLPALQAAAER